MYEGFLKYLGASGGLMTYGVATFGNNLDLETLGSSRGTNEPNIKSTDGYSWSVSRKMFVKFSCHKS